MKETWGTNEPQDGRASGRRLKNTMGRLNSKEVWKELRGFRPTAGRTDIMTYHEEK